MLGIVGMHGLVLGAGTTTAHHATPPAAVMAADPATAPVGSHSHDADAAASSSTSPSDEDDGSGASAIALCIALLLALAGGAGGVRRTTWVATLDRMTALLTPPAAPLLRNRAPVPRFTVMRC